MRLHQYLIRFDRIYSEYKKSFRLYCPVVVSAKFETLGRTLLPSGRCTSRFDYLPPSTNKPFTQSCFQMCISRFYGVDAQMCQLR